MVAVLVHWCQTVGDQQVVEVVLKALENVLEPVVLRVALVAQCLH